MFARTLLTPGAALIVAAPAAPVVVAPAAPVAASGDWSGFYAGGQLGFGSLDIDDNLAGTAPFEDGSYDGATYGLHAGYMFDFGRIVAGAEVDFDGTQIAVDGADIASSEDLEVGSVVRGKLRVGYDAGRFLPYLTAGVAQVRLNSDDAAVDAVLEDKYDGRFIGVGAAYQLNDRFVIGAEVLRHNFEDTPLDNVDVDVTTATLRASIRF